NMKNNNLVTSFLEAVRTTGTMSDGVREMNKALGTNYRLSRVREWERGTRQANPATMQYMLTIVLTHALAEYGLSKEHIKKIIDSIKLP
ncbi:hypothetical protein, partial [Thiolapillus sp.]|uniref:hypothetical protein n=1 Tax=Thiolapillus sp. TaxID=2017437 RepID=UPI0025D2D6B0